MISKKDPLSSAFSDRKRTDSTLSGLSDGIKEESEYFDEEVYSDIRQAAATWGQSVADIAQMTVMVPASLWTFSEFSDFPDIDISTLGIGNHRYFLFHSAAVAWALKKIYDARLASSEGSSRITDKVIDRIVGVMAGSGAYAVGIHLALDVVQPKSVVFPFIGSPVDGTLIDDNIWLMGNSLYCFYLGNQMFALALGEDLPCVKAFVKKNFIEPVSQGVIDAISGRNRKPV